MFSLAVWKLDWWKEQFTEISFWFALYNLLTGPYTLINTLVSVFVIGLNDEQIKEFLKAKIAPSLSRGLDKAAEAAKEP